MKLYSYVQLKRMEVFHFMLMTQGVCKTCNLKLILKLKSVYTRELLLKLSCSSDTFEDNLGMYSNIFGAIRLNI